MYTSVHTTFLLLLLIVIVMVPLQVWSVYLFWLIVSRTMKLMPHLRRKPGHIVYLLHYIIFSYIAAIVKIYALCTLHRTGNLKERDREGGERARQRHGVPTSEWVVLC